MSLPKAYWDVSYVFLGSAYRRWHIPGHSARLSSIGAGKRCISCVSSSSDTWAATSKGGEGVG
eukprot:15326616-Ditylum_brightwellii.AAC.1